MTLDLDVLTLSRGAHVSREDGVCLLEAAAWWAGEDHSDHPRCVSPILAAFGRALNDGLDDESRQRLVPLIPRLVGTAGDGHDEARAWMAVDWLARAQAPAWLRLLGRDDLADALEHCAPLRSAEEARAAQPLLDEAQHVADRAYDAAWAAARNAARNAAREDAREDAREAAWDAAEAAARAAGLDAAQDAAQHAAWYVAQNTARDAAREAAAAAGLDAAAAAGLDAAAAAQEAAWYVALDAAAAAQEAAAAAALDAATAAREAAREAAKERLRPTVAVLKASAFDLFDQMISLGEVGNDE